MLTYDVRIWGIRKRNSKSAPFQLRWLVGGQTHQQPFQSQQLADGRRAELKSAVRRGEQFDVETGLPVSELRERNSPTWYEHACDYALMKWPNVAAKHRAGIAEALTNMMPVLVSGPKKGAPDPQVLRQALRVWAFQCVRDDKGEFAARKDVEDPPEEVAAALEWVAKHSVKVVDMDDSDRIRRALRALSTKLDGTSSADNTFRRKRTVLSNALRYAIERGLLTVNPLSRIDWDPPETDDEVDFRYVPGPELARELLEAVRAHGPRGQHLHAFFGCLYYAGMRPSEAAALTERDCKLPESGWGELVLAGSRPEVGAGWTDDGTSYEIRGLKRRARKTTRPVPIPPVLVQLLRRHLDEYGTAEDGRLFRAVRGGRVRSTEYTEVWQEARRKALPAEEVDSALAEVPYSLRHAGISLWIKAGVDPVEVARRAGHSIAVLWKFYAKLLRGQQNRANRLIDDALNSTSDEAG
ncbi:tyrosine-type recombinase/integrase [Streptomyces hygroscopicus subsp. hygroscopicus]|uniref:tyrosine-type recombinase/integrase n=1 Tax=Streptomyces hygroscopicus TaxID=1912 RepID=UPI001C6566B0|nr:tyrosine-type recombinase/integrase [Streptomyces hygroscopicus]MBW8088488.1 tyrosine-type recombinase/integrase [Streptomyces hygroscopicus subsp. hygroscopicus]